MIETTPAGRFRLAALPFIGRLKTMPAIFLPASRLRENAKRQGVRRNSDIVIDGFWRCGNHFATFAFMVAQPTPLKVAHHVHAPAQLIRAARWRIPAVLLIREPVDAVASSTIYFAREDPGLFLKLYNIFHGPLVEYADRIVVSDFSQTVNDFGSVIAAVNARYSREFALFHGTTAERERVEEMIRGEHEENMGANVATLPLPSGEKARIKERVLANMSSPAYESRLREARRLYDALRARAVRTAAPAMSESQAAVSP
jgi:hypothetical protein